MFLKLKKLVLKNSFQIHHKILFFHVEKLTVKIQRKKE